MRLVFHGAAREVGRSCIEIQTEGDRYLLDCGIKFTSDGFAYPQNVFEVGELDGVFLSHAHLDHSGGLPMFEHYKMVCPIFCTHQTLALTKALLKDSYKIAHIQHLHDAYAKTDIKEVEAATTRIETDTWYKHRKLTFRFVNAGHIPGSAGILFKNEGKTVFYTGDFNTRTTKLMQPADYGRMARELGPVDCLITECTYGTRKLPSREELEPLFIESIRKVLARGGSVLVPVFAVGRAQEILIMLGQHQWNVPIYYDGMAKEVARTILTQPSNHVINKDLLNRMYFDVVRLVGSEEHRKQAATRGPAIIVATSGMMQGGPAIEYLRHLWHDERNAVFLTGYQVKGTNGRHLLEEGYVHLDGWKTPVKCEVKKFDFSGHADIEDIKRMIWAVKPKKVIFQHGDEESVVNMLAWARQETPFEAYGPELDETIEL